MFRSSSPEVFLWKNVLRIYSNVTGEHPCWSVISINVLLNSSSLKFYEIGNHTLMTSARRGEGYNEFKVFLDVVRGGGRRVAAVLDVPYLFFLPYKTQQTACKNFHWSFQTSLSTSTHPNHNNELHSVWVFRVSCVSCECFGVPSWPSAFFCFENLSECTIQMRSSFLGNN